jgi:hypothetical protein
VFIIEWGFYGLSIHVPAGHCVGASSEIDVACFATLLDLFYQNGGNIAICIDIHFKYLFQVSVKNSPFGRPCPLLAMSTPQPG